MQDVVAATVAREGRAPAPFGLYLISSWDPAAELARSVEREVFAEFFGNTPELLAREYDPYEPGSHFLVVVDHHELRPAGACRLTDPATVGNKTVGDLSEVWGIPPVRRTRELARSAWDVATLAVSRDYRGARTDHLVSAALFQGITMVMAANGVRWVTATLDLVVHDLVQRQCGEPFRSFPGAEPRSYLDSPLSIPVWCDGDAYRRRLAGTRPDLHRFLFDGAGLEGLVSAPRWALDELATAV